MKAKFAWFAAAGMLGLSILMPPVQSAEDAATAQKHKPIMINRFYTGPDGQTHVEEIEAKFAGGGENEMYKLLANAGAELRRAPPGRVADWHTAPRRQYVITISGHGELEIAPAKRSRLGPAASIWSKTSLARATSPGRWATKIA